MAEHVVCALCGSDDYKVLFQAFDKLFYHDDRYPVVRCRNCGLVYLNPRPSPAEKRVYYQEAYAFASGDSPVGLDHYLPVIDFLSSECSPGRVLDIGTGNSPFLPQMRQRGWEVHGTEVESRIVDKFHNDYGIDLFLGELEDAGFADETFDAVTIFGVLEHVSDPGRLFEEVRRILKPGGFLCLWYFNRGVEASLLGRCWLGFDPPRHFYSFSHATVNRLLRQTGFEEERIYYPRVSYIPYDLVWAFRRLKNRVRHSHQPTFVFGLPGILEAASRPLAGILAGIRQGSNAYVFARRMR